MIRDGPDGIHDAARVPVNHKLMKPGKCRDPPENCHPERSLYSGAVKDLE